MSESTELVESLHVRVEIEAYYVRLFRCNTLHSLIKFNRILFALNLNVIKNDNNINVLLINQYTIVFEFNWRR